MACVIKYKGKDYSHEQFQSMLHDGLLDEFISKKSVDSSGFVPTQGNAGTTSGAPGKTRKFAQQILSDPDISDEIKKGLSEDAKTYIPKSLSVTNYEAQAIIQAKGLEQSMVDFLDSSSPMSSDVRVTLGENLIKRFNEAKDYDNAIKVANNLTQIFTDAGRLVNAAKVFGMLTPEGVLRATVSDRSKQKEAFSKKTSSQRKQVKEAIDKINQDAIDKVLSDKNVKTKIEGHIKKGKIKQAIDFLETLKVDTKGKALDATYGLTAALWNTLITGVQKGLQAGLTLSQAIERASSSVKKKATDSYDESGAKQFLSEKLKDYRVTLDPELAVKEEIKQSGKKIDDVVREHYSVVSKTGEDIVSKLISESKLSKEEAVLVKKELEQAFDKLTKQAKERALKKYLPKVGRKQNIKTLTQKIIEASNVGALSEDKYRQFISDELGPESITDEQAKQITELADRIQSAKEGFDKTRATEKLMNYLSNIKGWSWVDAGMAIWYANILSGLSTQVLNITANFNETIGEAYVSFLRNPKQAAWILKGLFSGWGRGILESMETFKSGAQPAKVDQKIGSSSLLERIKFKGGAWNPYNYLKYVSRVMTAADIFFYHGLREVRSRELAVAMAKKENKTDPNIDIIKRASQIVYGGSNPYEDAFNEAKAEGWTGRDLKRRSYEILEQKRPEFVIKDSNDFAARGTFNYDPEGTMGGLVSGINYLIENVGTEKVKPLKFIVPFTRIIANVTNRYLDWTPVGLVRGIRGEVGLLAKDRFKRKLTQEERSKVLIKATTGITAIAALYALSDDDDGIFTITADGTGDTKKNYELQETGWRPYSIKIGDTWYEYKNTPLAIPMAMIGFIRDAQKYRSEKDLETKFSIFAFGSLKYVMDMSFLQSLSSFFDTFSKDNTSSSSGFLNKSKLGLSRTVKSVIVPNAFTQVSRSIQELNDMPMKRARGMLDQIIRDMPVLRDHLGNLYNSLGEPVVPAQNERFIPFKPSGKTNEKIWELIAENDAWIGAPSKNTLKPNGQSMTDDEYDKFSLLAGQLTKTRLQENYSSLILLNSKQEVKDAIEDLKRQARREARDTLFGFDIF